MYYQELPLSDVDSTVTPIEYVAVGERQYGCLLESDELSSLDLMVDRQRNKGKRVQDKPTMSSSSSDQSDQPANESTLSANDFQNIYKEFQEINKKLREENQRLHDREEAVKERERLVSISQNNIHTITDFQVKQQLREKEEQHQAEVLQLEQQLNEKTRQNKRLRENFETLKLANDTLRKELETLQIQHEKLERQSNSLQGRLTNLQRKQELTQRQPVVNYPPSIRSSVPSTEDKQAKLHKHKDTHITRITKPRVGVYDILGVLLDWVCDLHLRQALLDPTTRPPESAISPDASLEKCLKILPSLAEVIRDFPSSHSSIYLPCLQFIYWSLINLEQSQHPQKSSLSSTLRRLGEELYKPRVVRFLDGERVCAPISPTRTQDKGDKCRDMFDKGDKSRELLFFRSADLHSRFLSSLIILKTLTQADVLAHVFDCLRNDLKSNTGKDLFLYYQATALILPFLRPVHKTFLSPAVDIYLQMSMESAFLPEFLKSCSNENWFRTIARVVRSPSLPTETLEKISIILQKLSKMKSNKKYFAVYTITSVIQELVRGVANDSAFLSMNLKSILFNLGVQQVKVSTAEH